MNKQLFSAALAVGLTVSAALAPGNMAASSLENQLYRLLPEGCGGYLWQDECYLSPSEIPIPEIYFGRPELLRWLLSQ